MARVPIPLLGTDDGACQSDAAAYSGFDVPEMSDLRQTNILGLNVTMQCPLRCDHCCYACHPKREERMPLDLALSLVEQAGELGVFSAAGFTGGEPFLWLDELLEVGAALQEVGLPFNVVTASHWAGDAREAAELVDRLADLGMYRLTLSTDPSHARFVPPANVVNAARAASARGLGIDVHGSFNDPDASLETFVPELVGVPGVQLYTRAIAEVGRAKKMRGRVDRDLGVSLDGLRCYRSVYHDLLVFWDGDAYPCCSVFNRDTDGIRLGNAYTDSLQTIWERAEGSLLLRVMKRVGFAHLYAVLEDLDPALHARLPPLRADAGPCALCNQIFSDVDLAREIRNAFVAYECRTIDALLTSLEEEFGAEDAADIVKSALNATGRKPT